MLDNRVNWHSLDWKEAVRYFASDAKNGLTSEEALDRLKRFGENRLPEQKPDFPRLRIFLGQLKSPLIYILLAAGIITVLLHKFTDSIVIFLAVVLNTAVGYIQESKASKALQALKKVIKLRALVIRDGREIEIDSEELVPGDIIVLSPGGKIPADARLLESSNLKVNEAALTGEWLPAQKSTDVLKEDTPLADRDNMVYMGTIVEEGIAKAIVTATGINTEIGKVSALLREGGEEKTPLQKRLAGFSGLIGGLLLLMVFLIFLGGILQRRDFIEIFTTSVAVAVAAIPEGLPVALTVILALGMQRILKKRGLVRRLLAAETLGSTSVICTDKTLTLTEGKMAPAETVTSGIRVSNEGPGWRENFRASKDEDQQFLITIASLTNEAFIENPEDFYGLWRVRGRPTDRAMVMAGAAVGFRKPDLSNNYFEIDEIPFKQKNKFIAKLFRKGKNFVLFIAGAPERILELSSSFRKKGKAVAFSVDSREFFENQLERLTSKGLRVIALGYKEYGENFPQYKDLEEICSDFVFSGLLAFHDPLRPEAKEAIKMSKKAGIRTILVTGDHLLTAKAVAQEIGLKVNKNSVIEGRELDKMSEEDFRKRFEKIDVYARVEPHHKMRIVKAWQEKGEVVAMTGDGINDAPALKQADIGVALGSGTDVAKEVSDLVLLTDNFDIIPSAIEEGRRIMDNIRKVITYLLTSSFTEIILIGVSIIFGLPLPVTAVQILWVNLVQDGLPDIALAFEPKEKDLMQRKPQKDGHLLTSEMKGIIFIIGILTDLVLLGIFLWYLGKGLEINHLRTIVFATLGTNTLFYIFSCKSLRRNIWKVNPFSNMFLNIAVLAGFIAMFSAIYFAPFQILLKTTVLSLKELAIVFGFGLLNIILIETAKYYYIIFRGNK